MADKSHLKIWFATSMFLLAIVPTAGGQIVFVDDDATGANDGSSWADAHNCLQDALVASANGDEIWVAEGTYKPDRGGGITLGDRTATFELKDGVALYGGFPSGGGNWEDRDLMAYETLLSGDLNSNDVPVVDPRDLPDEPTRAENSYHVITSSGNNETAVLDGFTITAGNANGSYPNGYGGGMCNSSSPAVNNCTFTINSAISGGGMYSGGGSPALTNCTFRQNAANMGGGMGIFVSSPTVTDCTFRENTANFNGGGMNCQNSSSPALTNCTFRRNTARSGGGMDNQNNSSPTVINCTFAGNSAGGGGGMSDERSSPTLTNCTFSGNSASGLGGGMHSHTDSSPTLANCILWGNTASDGAQIGLDDSTLLIRYCDVQGGQAEIYDSNSAVNWGAGNIGGDPRFVDADGHDNIIGTEDDNLRLSAGSPCIDAGDNHAVPLDANDIDGQPRFLDDPDTADTGNGTPPIADLGAYEYHEYTECLPYDWNDDGFISIIGDVPPFVGCVYFGNCPNSFEEFLVCVGDCSGDGIVSIVGDVPCFVNCVYFGNCPE